MFVLLKLHNISNQKKQINKIILMNFFPGLYQNKRVKKPTNFSNPLTGALYNNRDYLINCKNVPRSISNLDHISQLKFDKDNDQEEKTQRILHPKMKISLKKKTHKRIQRQIIAVHATSRLAAPLIKNGNKSVIMSKRCIKAFDSDALNEFQKLNHSMAFSLNKLNKQVHSIIDHNKGQQYFNDKNNANTYRQTSVFHDIQILILDLLNNHQDLKTKIIKITMQKYFRSFFKKQLSGHFTQDFLKKVEYYIQKLLYKQNIDQPVDQQQYPIQLFTIGSRIAFLNKIQQFQSRKSNSNNQYIQTLIKYYCIPSKQFRQSCIRDILLMLGLQIFQKFNCNRHQEYILLNQNGQQITQILQIKFSTTKLFLTSKKNANRNYHNYISLLDQYYRQGKKLNFNENIKLNFRNKLANGNVDQNHFNYCENYQIQKVKRLTQLEAAQIILKKRSQIHRVSKFGIKEQMVYYQRPLIVQNKSKEQTQQLRQNQKFNQNDQLNMEPQPSQFWKIQNTRINPQTINRTSQSPNRSNSPYRGFIYTKKQNQVERSKLKQFISNGKKNNINANLQNKFREQFKQLHAKNDFIDFKFNHRYKDRVTKASLKQYFSYFKQKSDLQINKIFTAVKASTLSITNTMNPSTSIKKQDQIQQNSKQPIIKQFVSQQIQGQQTSDSSNLQNSFSWQQFKNMRIVISCIQPKQILMAFIGNYLNFNEYGQLSKAQLFNQVLIILGQNTDTSTSQVILEVIWSWFQCNSIIQNQTIRRTTLQSWYQKFKIVYCMFISLIFGTNHKTPLDLAYQILV